VAVNLDDGAVEEGVLEIGSFGERREDPLEDAFLGPSSEALTGGELPGRKIDGRR
jgi:hypothetical protein